MKVDPVVASWVLDALRRVIGLEDVRNEILKKELKQSTKICYGKTFGSETKKKELMAYLESIVVGKTDCDFLVMTATNFALAGETHYQVFILDYVHRHLWVIDPSSVKKTEGIYTPYISTLTIMPFFEDHGWTTEFVSLTHPCQTTYEDVFCQSWSLLLGIEFLKKLKKKDTTELKVFPSLTRRYSKLLKFYQQYLPLYCEDLKEIYQQTIKTSRDLVKGIKDKKEKQKVIQYYLQFDPCEQLEAMKASDLMTEEQLKNKK